MKCRIVYGRSLSEISFAPYVPREIRSLRLVAADDELDYHLKYADRSALARLLQRRDDCDEILIVRDGAITDTSYSNVAFFDGRKYVTPDTFLLNGTRRQYLLGTGVLTECRITPSDLGGFERVVTDFVRDVAHEFEARDQGVDVGLGNDEILVVAGLYIGIL